MTQLVHTLNRGLDLDLSFTDAIVSSTQNEWLDAVCELSLSRMLRDPRYEVFAKRALVQSIHNRANAVCGGLVANLRRLAQKDIVDERVVSIAEKHQDRLESAICHERDELFDTFGLHTLRRSYLLEGETPQYMWMRVALGIHMEDVDRVLLVYNQLSQLYYTHATPTLFHAGTNETQLCSCFLLGMGDSVVDIFKAISDSAIISKQAGGIGLHLHEIRGKGSLIRSTQRTSDGIVPLCRVINDVAQYINQGGRRKGSIAVYVEPWHPDIEDFLELRKPMGEEQHRARDLFLGLWIPDLFMECVRDDQDWHLVCPSVARQLANTYGDAFCKAYKKVCDQGKIVRTVRARALWNRILTSQIETGMPYMAYKDNVNAKTNQCNLGVIRSSNLCCEIMQYSNTAEYAVCNLASLSLSSCCKETCDAQIARCSAHPDHVWMQRWSRAKGIAMSVSDSLPAEELVIEWKHADRTFTTIGLAPGLRYCAATFDFAQLDMITRSLVRNLNRLIDVNKYPVPETRTSNLWHRPVGLGVQGLADAYAKCMLPFDSEEAAALNRMIFATIYYACVDESCTLAMERAPEIHELKKRLGEDVLPVEYNPAWSSSDRTMDALYHRLRPMQAEVQRSTCLGAYASFTGSPASRGDLQYKLWNVEPVSVHGDWELDWQALENRVKLHGMRNSLVTALMPTASTSQILGNNECFEPFTSNLYTRSTVSGEHVIVNRHMLYTLQALGLWSDQLRDRLVQTEGSIQGCEDIPLCVRQMYKTAFELPQKVIVQQSVDRGPYIDQSQSLNIFMEKPDFTKLSSLHFYAWKNGLKTGMYYLRSKPATSALKFGVQSVHDKAPQPQAQVCNRNNPTCESCSG